MKRLRIALLTSPMILSIPSMVLAQRAEAPKHQGSLWWKIKVEVRLKGGYSRSPKCEEAYDQYLVKMVSGVVRVYGIASGRSEQIDCPPIESQLLDSGNEVRGFLKFPLEIKNPHMTWSAKYKRPLPRRGYDWPEAMNEVIGVVKFPDDRGRDVFKIKRGFSNDDETIFYDPTAEAIVLYERDTPALYRKAVVTDFGRGEPPIN